MDDRHTLALSVSMPYSRIPALVEEITLQCAQIIDSGYIHEVRGYYDFLALSRAAVSMGQVMAGCYREPN